MSKLGKRLIAAAKEARGNYEERHTPETELILKREELEGRCHALWLLNGGETEEWNGDSCDCKHIQGILNCKLNPY